MTLSARIALLLTGLAFGAPASAATIALNKSASLLASAQASAAFDYAAAYYAARLTDPVSVLINADFAPMSPGTLGSTQATWLSAGYSTIRNAMVSDQSLSGQAGDITEQLPTYAQYSAYVPDGGSLSSSLLITSANAKALGFDVSGIVTSDADISFNSNFAFDFDPSDGITAGLFDFVGVALHEIGHVLGFVSTVDYVDCVFAGDCSGLSGLSATPLDLFRLEPGAGVTDFTSAPRVLTTGADIADQVLYLGGGVEYAVSTGVFSGDGRQASHWKDNLSIGLLDPTLAPGEYGYLTGADWRAFDLIGWDVALETQPVPLPGAAWLLGSGLLGLAGYRRRTLRP